MKFLGILLYPSVYNRLYLRLLCLAAKVAPEDSERAAAVAAVAVLHAGTALLPEEEEWLRVDVPIHYVLHFLVVSLEEQDVLKRAHLGTFDLFMAISSLAKVRYPTAVVVGAEPFEPFPAVDDAPPWDSIPMHSSCVAPGTPWSSTGKRFITPGLSNCSMHPFPAGSLVLATPARFD